MLREERKNALKTKIFVKSLELFKEDGYENVTVEQIASACGIAKGTFFNYFSKKEHLLLHLGESQIELFKEVLHKHQHVCIKKRIELIFQDLLMVYLEQAEILKLTIPELIRLALKEESRNIDVFKDNLTTIINEAKTKDQLHNHFNSRNISSVLVGIYFNTLITWSLNENTDNGIVEIFQEQFEVVWGGIGNKNKIL